MAVKMSGKRGPVTLRSTFAPAVVAKAGVWQKVGLNEGLTARRVELLNCCSDTELESCQMEGRGLGKSSLTTQCFDGGPEYGPDETCDICGKTFNLCWCYVGAAIGQENNATLKDHCISLDHDCCRKSNMVMAPKHMSLAGKAYWGAAAAFELVDGQSLVHKHVMSDCDSMRSKNEMRRATDFRWSEACPLCHELVGKPV